MKRPEDLKSRTRRFALQVIRLYSSLPKETVAQVLGKQLLRSGTSVGAQYHEGTRARSNAEFISKVEGALQELEESIYWMEILVESGILSQRNVENLLKEADELAAILVASVKTVKERRNRAKN
ncbi:MAG: four helix bundle protein [Deltaproteobacteria bacterium]|nr:MAG: four helix bundle protein [Deltaproteobacteria bacterium]